MKEFQDKVRENYIIVNKNTVYEGYRVGLLIEYIKHMSASEHPIREAYVFKSLLVLTELCCLWGIDLDKLINDYD